MLNNALSVVTAKKVMRLLRLPKKGKWLQVGYAKYLCRKVIFNLLLPESTVRLTVFVLFIKERILMWHGVADSMYSYRMRVETGKNRLCFRNLAECD